MHVTKGFAAGSRSREFHRWVAMVFTGTVIANFVARARGIPPAWVTYSPLLPLAALMLTGLYLFAMPYIARRRSRSRT